MTSQNVLLDDEDDDLPIGRILSRREVLTLLGTGGLTFLAGGAAKAIGLAQLPPLQTTPTATPAHSVYLPVINGGSGATATVTPSATATTTATPTATATTAATAVPSCVVRPEVTEGPYFVDEKLNRSDIRSDPTTGTVKAGAQLDLTFQVMEIGSNSCTPLSGATVDIWHCDAAGLYSDVSNNNTVGQKFLRGYQTTDSNGAAAFTTIYPGWYSGRAVHIHFKIRIGSKAFTSQLFFEETLNDTVHAQSPYASKGTRDVLNSTDNIYQDLLLLTVTKTSAGYAATFQLGVDLT